ncbi:coiled-coil domain-containing protein 40-like isoform X2 [Dunckerocampus dactyliophorus]|uniref:coiled-coil domain-containing protein 40-like isoform X2 n=1 Tax=Dunckerocampus dactyliophorus TaxID=161453 RepID=UPI0024062617|nr:coiled-coil domain-containing protein 40-like isoform X2 [Dunckerocampus dactyliophorus]
MEDTGEGYRFPMEKDDQFKGGEEEVEAEKEITEQQQDKNDEAAADLGENVPLSLQDEPGSEPAGDLIPQPHADDLEADEEAAISTHTEQESIPQVLSPVLLPNLAEEEEDEQPVLDPNEEEEFVVLDAEHDEPGSEPGADLIPQPQADNLGADEDAAVTIHTEQENIPGVLSPDPLPNLVEKKEDEEPVMDPNEEEKLVVVDAEHDKPGSEPAGDLIPQPHADNVGVDEEAAETIHTELETVPRVLSPVPLSNLVEEKEDEESVMDSNEEEEFVVLDADHPLIAKKQAALKHQLITELERLTVQLQQDTGNEKAESNETDEIFTRLYREQQRLKALQIRLEDQQKTKVLAESKHREAQDQLAAIKACHSSTASQSTKTKANVSKLQTELEKLWLHVVFTQEATEDLHSNVKATKSATRKVGTKKSQAEDEKHKQDMYVERLTKELDKLTQQMDIYEAQTNAQAETTHATQEALSEAEMQMESLAMAQKQLLQQWNSSLLSMRRQDEEFGVIQEAVRMAEHQVIVLDREIEGNKKSISELQEKSETLTMLLNCAQMDCDVSKKLINQKQTQHEALQNQYSTYIRALGETERTLADLTKEDNGLQAELTDQRRKLEKNSNKHLELEDHITTQMLQKLMDSKASQYYKRLTSKKAAVKKKKVYQLWHLESSVMAAALQSNVINEKLENLVRTQKELDMEITKYNKVVTSNQANSSSIDILISQKQTTIANMNKKIDLIAARTGHEDLSPLQIKVERINSEIEKLSEKIKNDQQIWLKHQGTLVGLTLEIQAHTKEYNKLQAKLTMIRQKKVYLQCQLDVLHREESDVEKSKKMLQRDLLKLNTLLSKNAELRHALEQENMIMETKFLHKLKDAERESIEMELKVENTQEAKEKLLSSLVETERQIMLWEKKTHLMKETRLVVEEGQGDIRIMKDDIHRMERWLYHLTKKQEQLLRESVAVVERRGNIIERNEILARSTKKLIIKGELNLMNDGLRRKIKETQKLVKEYSQEIRELQEAHEEFHRKSKKIQEMMDGTPASTASLEVTLQSEMERVHKVSTIIHRVWAEMPKYQGCLWKVLRSLAEYTEAEAEASQ